MTGLKLLYRMDKLKYIYLDDVMKVKKMPILSCGTQLEGKNSRFKFQLDMYKTYNTIEEKANTNFVDIKDYNCVACQYGLKPKELYQNMIQIRDSK